MTNDLSNMMQKILGSTVKQVPSSNLNQHQSVTFTLDPNNSNRAIGSDKATTLFLEYHPSPANSYIQYVGPSNEISLCFENHHNGSCSIFIGHNQSISQKMIDHIKAALFVLGFKDSISFDIFGG